MAVKGEPEEESVTEAKGVELQGEHVQEWVSHAAKRPKKVRMDKCIPGIPVLMCEAGGTPGSKLCLVSIWGKLVGLSPTSWHLSKLCGVQTHFLRVGVHCFSYCVSVSPSIPKWTIICCHCNIYARKWSPKCIMLSEILEGKKNNGRDW